MSRLHFGVAAAGITIVLHEKFVPSHCRYLFPVHNVAGVGAFVFTKLVTFEIPVSTKPFVTRVVGISAGIVTADVPLADSAIDFPLIPPAWYEISLPSLSHERS